jgi:hypothetical protein
MPVGGLLTSPRTDVHAVTTSIGKKTASATDSGRKPMVTLNTIEVSQVA